MGLFTNVNLALPPSVSYSPTFGEKVEKAGDLLMSPLYLIIGETRTVDVILTKDKQDFTILLPDVVSFEKSRDIIRGVFKTLLWLPLVAVGIALKWGALSFSAQVQWKHSYAFNPRAYDEEMLSKKLTARLPIETRLHGQQGEEKYGLELLCGMCCAGCEQACGA